MDIGISIPMRNYGREELAVWAKMAEEGPFSSVTTGERLCYPNHDPMTVLSVVAGMTERIRLHAGVVVGPLHNPVTLAKRAASLDILSGGRLMLGVGAGPRKPDFDASKMCWTDRGKRHEEMLKIMRRVWRGEPPYEGTEPVPPVLAPGRPQLIGGGFVDASIRRAGRLCDGFHSFDFNPEVSLHVERFRKVQEAWDEAERPGKPWLLASTFFCLGPNASEIYRASMDEFYGETKGYAIGDMQNWAASSRALTSREAIRDAIKRFEDAGFDEILLATSYHLGPESLGWLADVIR